MNSLVRPDVMSPLPPLPAPERAIRAFEQTHNLQVTVHDLAGSISPFIRPDRFHHRSPLCLAVKAQGRHETCVAFEITRLRAELGKIPEGRCHVCHAGLVEWTIPVFSSGKLLLVLFAGPCRIGTRLRADYVAPQLPWPKSPWASDVDLPREIDEDESQLIMEHLRQLAARLQILIEGLNIGASKSSAKSPDAHLSNSLNRRQVTILRFIEENYTESVTLADLAKRLALSESRVSHVVRQSCNASFRELLVERRIRGAMELLRDSGMSVLQVALSCGFEDVAHFHRLFRQRVGVTPAKYRISGQS